MNVIVSNVNVNEFANLDVDIIKSISGEFTVDEIVQSFSNFFFNRMFLDITAIHNYVDVSNLKKLSIGLDVSKIILLLSDDPVVNTDAYISSLISMGIYNFARTEEELKYLYDNPNSYKDVAHLQKIDEVQLPKLENIAPSGVKIIGFKNFTSHAGSTSLIYMLKKQLSKNYYVIAIEVNKRDFMFYNDKDMVSCSSAELSNVLLKYQNANIILIDLNDIDLSIAHHLCGDVLYLMESSVLKINKAIMLDHSCFEKLSDKKVILNQSMLDNRDVEVLQNEAGIRFFFVLPSLNDRKDNAQILYPFLEKLGLYRRVS